MSTVPQGAAVTEKMDRQMEMPGRQVVEIVEIAEAPVTVEVPVVVEIEEIMETAVIVEVLEIVEGVNLRATTVTERRSRAMELALGRQGAEAVRTRIRRPFNLLVEERVRHWLILS